MTFPNDQQLVETAGDLLAQLKTTFGSHPGFRGAHAKGIILAGSFTPSAEASKLSKAEHFNTASTPVWVRFSNSTGIPKIPDNNSDADPRGMAIRFHLPEINGRRRHTDVIGHSVPLFPVRTGAEFLELLRAIGASGPDVPHPSPVEKLIRGGKETYIRYHVVPESGVQTLDETTVKAKGENYLQDELPDRLKGGPIVFKLKAQVAEGDVTDNATVPWPESRKLVELGTVKIESIVPDNANEQKTVIFDPVPRIEGVESSADPLLEMRAALYLLGGKERRTVA